MDPQMSNEDRKGIMDGE